MLTFKNMRHSQCGEAKYSPAKLTLASTVLLTILWWGCGFKKLVDITCWTFLDRRWDICIGSQIEDLYVLVHAVCVCCICVFDCLAYENRLWVKCVASIKKYKKNSLSAHFLFPTVLLGCAAESVADSSSWASSSSITSLTSLTVDGSLDVGGCDASDGDKAAAVAVAQD